MLAHPRARADIKPTNVFLTAAGDVKLGDLGLGRALSSRSAQADSLVGTPFYMSPEVIENQAYSYASDMWQLGCTIYEIAMLRSPFSVADGGAGDAAAGSGQSAAPAPVTAGGNANLFAVAQRILACDFPPLSDIYTAPLRQLVHSMLQRDPAARPTAAQVEETLRARLSQGLANYEDLGVIGRGACARVSRRENEGVGGFY
jgi:serine/threonine protein kinase